MEENKDVRVRCNIAFEQLEETEFCRYSLAIPVEDLTAGYTIGNSRVFQCTIDDELKYINIISIEVTHIVEVDFGEDGDELLCLVYGFIGLSPMTEDEQQELEKQREEYAKKLQEEDSDDVEDLEYTDADGEESIFDLRKNK